jgi:hypothetical protein
MRMLNSALMVVSAISLAGCIVEPTSSRQPPLGVWAPAAAGGVRPPAATPGFRPRFRAAR